MQNGKGDKPRVTNWQKYSENFDQINWSKSTKKKSEKNKLKKPSTFDH